MSILSTQRASTPRQKTFALIANLLLCAMLVGCPKTVISPPPVGVGRSTENPTEIALQKNAIRGKIPRVSFKKIRTLGPTRGPLHAPLHVVEFFNPLDPSAKTLHAIRQKAWERFPGSIRWIVFFNPDLLKDRGYFLSRALFSSHRFGSFWPYFRRFSEEPSPPTESRLLALAETVGIDRTQMDVILRSVFSEALVDRDLRVAHHLSILGKPGLFINGIRLPAPLSEASVLAALQDEFSRAKKLLSLGLTSEVLHDTLTEKAADPGSLAPLPSPIALMQLYPLAFAITEAVPVRGPGDAPVQIVEFSDFTCVPCRAAWFNLKRLQTEFPQQIRLFFKVLPIGIHAQGQRAGEIAIAAQTRKVFWKMADVLFQEQARLLRGEILPLVKEGGLDPDLLSGELDRGTYKRRILINQAHARTYGIRSVPTIFVNRRRLSLPTSYEALRSLFLEEVWRSGQPQPLLKTAP